MNLDFWACVWDGGAQYATNFFVAQGQAKDFRG